MMVMKMFGFGEERCDGDDEWERKVGGDVDDDEAFGGGRRLKYI